MCVRVYMCSVSRSTDLSFLMGFVPLTDLGMDQGPSLLQNSVFICNVHVVYCVMYDGALPVAL